jgi:acyl-CoA synthetase (AMP-forming)/AMP-acid ligase II
MPQPSSANDRDRTDAPDARPAYDASLFRQVFERHFTYEAGFRRNTHRYAGRPALTDGATGRSWTYAELGAEVDRLAAGLLARGLRPGDVLVYQLFNTPEFAMLYLATQRAGIVGSPINFRLAPGETAYILDDSRPKALIYDAALADSVGDALARADHRPELLVSVGDGEPVPGSVPFTGLPSSDADAEALPLPDRDTFAESTRLYTSGTTGMPKAVPLNSLVEVLTAHDVIMHFPLSPQDRTLNMSPWFHRGGLYSGGPNPVFYVGAEAVSLRAFDADTVLDYTERYRLTFLIGAPTNLAMLADAQQARPRDLSSLRGIVTMGAPLDRAAALRYQDVLTPRIMNGYGTTEAFWNTFLRAEDLPDGAGTAGRACTDDDVVVVKILPDRLARPDELAAKDGSEIGEVIVRSVKSGYSYLGNPTEQERKFHDGWLYAGDLASWDEGEMVTIVGRKDDMIISGGENVHPVQVEAALGEHPGVVDSAVVGVPDPQWGQLVVAYVVRRDPELTEAELDKHCKAHPMLADFKRPRAYRFVDALPMTATGKKVHYKIAEQAAGDATAGLLVRP